MANPGGFGGLFGSRPFNMNILFKMSDVTPRVQSHIANVFAALAATLLAAAAGVYVHLLTNAGGLLTTIAAFGCLMWLQVDKARPFDQRVAVLLAFGLLKGMSLGGLVAVVLDADSSILVTATLGTAVSFACFAAAALVAKRRSYLYLGATLGSALSVMALASLANLFLRSPLLLDANLYGGLLVFCGYVVFDTQMIVERASLGDFDVCGHAAELFVG
ncbi:unnamed protein product, partial [Phaeothamnion confervicola]